MEAINYTALALPILLGPVLFMRLPRHRAIVVLFVGWLFLPEIHLVQVSTLTEAPLAPHFAGFFLTKTNAIAFGTLLAILLFDARRLLAAAPRWFDLPLILWCLCPFVSGALNEGVGWFEGVKLARERALAWGVPYLAGRLYFTEFRQLQELALGLVVGAIAYVPLCLFEVVYGPEVNAIVYGFHQHDVAQSVRFGGYRPMVFMQHGLAVGLWMAMATLTAFWLWWQGAYRRLPVGNALSVSFGWVFAALMVTAVLVKSSGALVLLVLGVVLLLTGRYARLRLPILALLTLPVLYMWVRSTGLWHGEDLVAWLKLNFDPERAESLSIRLSSEEALVGKALQRPGFGWAGYNRSFLDASEAAKYGSTGIKVGLGADGFWILVLGDNGLFGLAMACATLLLQPFRFLWHYPLRAWAHPALAAPTLFAVVLGLDMVDDLLNSMFVPLFVVMTGALASVCGRPLPWAALAGPRPPILVEPEPGMARRRWPTPAYPPVANRPAGQPPGVLRRPRPAAN